MDRDPVHALAAHAFGEKERERQGEGGRDRERVKMLFKGKVS
jgi:hypothetical protein